MKTAEEYSDDVTKLWSKFDWGEINFNQFKNYVKNYIEQAQKDAYNEAWEHSIALRKRIGNPYNEREGKAMLDFEIEARKLKK